MGRYQPPAGAVEGEVLKASSTWLSKARFVQNDNFRTISIMIRLSNITARGLARHNSEVAQRAVKPRLFGCPLRIWKHQKIAPQVARRRPTL